MSAERLAVGDRVRCPKCRRWHPADRESSGSATDYAERMLFIGCGDVGQIGGAAVPAREVATATRTVACEESRADPVV